MFNFFKMRDKQIHILTCFIGTLLISIWLEPLCAAIGFFVFFSIVKELIYDFFLKRGSFDYKDLIANSVGSGII